MFIVQQVKTLSKLNLHVDYVVNISSPSTTQLGTTRRIPDLKQRYFIPKNPNVDLYPVSY